MRTLPHLSVGGAIVLIRQTLKHAREPGTMAFMSTNQQTRCTVCGQLLARNLEYKRRYYCDIHYSLFYQDTRPVWRASTLTLGILAAMLVALAIGSQVSPETFGSVTPPSTGILFVVFPVLVWFAALYRIGARIQFRLTALPVTIFVLAALLSAAVTRPFLHSIVNLDTWLGQTTSTNRLMGDILLNGFTHTFTIYALMRYIVWDSPAFARRTDGVMFALAASWGYATLVNILYVIDLGGVTLLNGGLRLITQLCTFLVTGLILGYFLGRNRFEDMPVYHLSVGLILSATVNGFLLYAGSALNLTSLSLTQSGFSPWPGVALSMGILILSFTTIRGLLQRQNALTQAKLEHIA
jgi:RsiW-degrading membrane proteinase PrsW (M82 family)